VPRSARRQPLNRDPGVISDAPMADERMATETAGVVCVWMPIMTEDRVTRFACAVVRHEFGIDPPLVSHNAQKPFARIAAALMVFSA